MSTNTRNMILILGDQLDQQATVLQDFDPSQDKIWMAEVIEESTHVNSSQQRTCFFLSAMRHFAQWLREKNWTVIYSYLDDANNTGRLDGELEKAIALYQPQRLKMTAPGDYRVLQMLRQLAHRMALPLEILDDSHFFSTVREFSQHAKNRKQLRLEFFYRELRQKTGILMQGNEPIGGQWNFDSDNRSSFGKKGPSNLPAACHFQADETTREVIQLVRRQLAHHPGQLELKDFHWPVTRNQALKALEIFIQERLPYFGKYQDAMWQGEAWLYHSHLAGVLNLKLLQVKEVVQAAEQAYHEGHAPIEAVEGFIRQILGWREYVRGIYWTQMPGYLQLNSQHASYDLPSFYWTGETPMACLQDAIKQTLRLGYAHHIQRLMVTGLYALLLGVQPQQVHEWYLAVYVDAVEWVELPNTLGMSQFADGGIMASKPYIASGKYIQKMSNHCQHCRFKPELAIGQDACPFTTLYWDYLQQHASVLSKNPRMLLQLKNLKRMSPEQLLAIQEQAQQHRNQVSTIAIQG